MPTSRLVQRRLNAHRDTAAAIEAAAPDAAEAMHEQFAPFLEDGETYTEADALTFIRLVQRRYAAAAEAMRAADEATDTERNEDTAARQARDTTLEDAADRLIELKAAIRSQYGDDFLHTMPLAPRTIRRGDDLLQQYERLVNWLGEAESDFPDQGGAFATGLTKAQVLTIVQSIHDALAERLEHVATEERETDQAFVAKDAALAEHDAVRSGTRALLKGLLRAVGMAKIAERL